MAANNSTHLNTVTDVQPLVTVIVPIYNVERYLSKCISSLINQTYHNLQILLINDGSTDNCGKICDQYAAVDNRIEVFHKINEGQASARNLGLSHVRGKYVNFIDSDDWIDLEFYEKLVNHAEVNGLEICVCSRRSYSEDTLISTLPVGNSPDVFSAVDQYISRYFFRPFTPSCCNKLYLARVIQDHNLRFLSVNEVGSEDALFNFSLLPQLTKVGSVDGVYYNQFVRAGSTTSVYQPGMLNRVKNLVSECLIVLDREKRNDTKTRAAVAYVLVFFVNHYISKLRDNQRLSLTAEIEPLFNNKQINMLATEILKNPGVSEILKANGYKLQGIQLTKVVYFLFKYGCKKCTAVLLRKIYKIS